MREYAEKVKAEMEKTLGCDLEIVEITKGNDIQHVGIIVKKEGATACPVFYVNDFYESKSPEGCAKIFCDLYEEMDAPPEIDKDMDLDYESVKDKLTFRILDAEINKHYVDQMLTKDVGCGLAMVPNVDLGEFRLPLTRVLAKEHKYDSDKVFADSLANAAKNDPAVLFTLPDSLNPDPANILEGGYADETAYVLSTDSRFEGAKALMYPSVLDKIRILTRGNFYILPSSIHECIIITDRSNSSVSDLYNMVKEANDSVVEKPDILSDNVYFYDGTLKIAE